MTARRRFAETMRYGHPDRVPTFEEGLRDDVLECWHEQGLPRDVDFSEMFEIDRREQIPVDLEPRSRLERVPRSRSDLDELRRRLDPEDPARLPDDWAQRVEAWRTRDHVLQLPVHRGFFLSMGVHDWKHFEEAITLLGDDPSLVADVMDIYGQFGARLASRILENVEVDFATFSEPIGGNDRPLVSPATYERIVLRSYQPVLDALRRGGVETIVFLTYANARVLLPAVLDAGFNCLWACEAETGAMNYRSLRRRFGRALRLIGGIDLDTLLVSKDAIREEIETNVRPLLAQGGYVPLADGRVRANVPLENYMYYRRLLTEIVRR
jgi:hypothetical protein